MPIILTDEEKARISQQFGANLIKIIEEKFDSEHRFVLLTGMKERLLFKLKKGGNPQLDTIALFAKALGVHPKELFDFEKREGMLMRKDFRNTLEYRKYLKGLEKQDEEI